MAVLHIEDGVPTNRLTDQQTDRLTNLLTDIVTYRAAEVQLKIQTYIPTRKYKITTTLCNKLLQ